MHLSFSARGNLKRRENIISHERVKGAGVGLGKQGAQSVTMTDQAFFNRFILRAVLRHVIPMVIRQVSISDHQMNLPADRSADSTEQRLQAHPGSVGRQLRPRQSLGGMPRKRGRGEANRLFKVRTGLRGHKFLHKASCQQQLLHASYHL